MIDQTMKLKTLFIRTYFYILFSELKWPKIRSSGGLLYDGDKPLSSKFGSFLVSRLSSTMANLVICSKFAAWMN